MIPEKSTLVYLLDILQCCIENHHIKMNYDRLLHHFGGLKKTSQALDTSMQTIHMWKVRGRVPDKWQVKAHFRSAGKLKPDKQALEFAKDVGLTL